METADISSPQQRGIQSILTGGTILEALASAGGPVMLRDLAEMTNIAPARLHPYLVSFIAIGMVEQTERGRYRLGPLALRIGLERLRAQDAYRDTIARVGDLSRELRLMISVSVWGAHGPTITYVQEHSARVHANVAVGGTYDMTVTATGKVFAAFLPEAVTEPVILRELQDEEFRRRAIYAVDATTFDKAVEETRQRGYATTRDVPIPGVSAVAAPVFDHSGKMKLALTAIGSTGVVDCTADGPLVARVLDFTRTLSANLGHVCPA